MTTEKKNTFSISYGYLRVRDVVSAEQLPGCQPREHLVLWDGRCCHFPCCTLTFAI